MTLKLANLLKHFEGRKKGVRIELISGRRPRIVFDPEGGGRGEVKNLGDEALTEDDVVELCAEAGAGNRLDSLPATFPYFDATSPYRVTVEMRGREIAATFIPKGASTMAKKASIPPRRMSRREIPAVETNDRKTVKPPKRSETPVSTRTARPTVRGMPKARPGESERRPSAPAVAAVKEAPSPAIARETRRKSIAAPIAGFASVAWPGDHGSGARISELLSEGRRLGASDLHMVAEDTPLLRVAGSLRPVAGAKASGQEAVLALVPRLLRDDVERRGGADFALDVPKHGRFRVNVTLTLRGPKASLRFLPREVPTFASLGFSELLTSATEHHQGLVVITGPSGHGKTTTLAAMVDYINAKSAFHIITVEDPVEIVHPSKSAIVSQREIGAQAKSFARALKGALRQDPDVIVVGELRDTETVRMALSASETGHLVLGTMNTPSAAATIEALIDLFPPGDQPQVRATLAGGLKYIVSQRLVPRADETGCAVALETLPGSLPLWNMIRDEKTFQLPSLMQRGKGLGIVRLNDSLADLVTKEIVTKAAALEASPSPDDLETLLGKAAEPPPGFVKPQVEERHQATQTLFERAGAFFSRKGE